MTESFNAQDFEDFQEESSNESSDGSFSKSKTPVKKSTKKGRKKESKVEEENVAGTYERPAGFDTNDDYEETVFCNNYGSSHVYNNRSRSILKDLQKYALEDEIKNSANVIYNKMIRNVRRGRRRDSLLFYCVSSAYKEAKRIFDPFELGKMFDLTSSEVQKTDSIFSQTKTGYSPPFIVYSPLDFIPYFGEKLNLSQETCEIVLSLAKTIFEKKPEILENAPQVIAAGILDYYTTTNGILVENKEIFSKFAGRSSITTDKISKIISAIDNS